jgi:hypothetical protein
MSTKFQIDWSNSLKVTRFQKSKMAPGLRLLSWIFFIIRKVRAIALFCPKLGKKIREDRSSGLKVIDIKKIQDGCHPEATTLD